MILTIEECPVCLSEYDNQRYPISLVPCGHLFCTECVLSLKTKACPICRSNFFTTQSNSTVLKQAFVTFLQKMEELVSTNHETNLELWKQNKKLITKLSISSESNLGLFEDESVRSGLRLVLDDNINKLKYDEIEYEKYMVKFFKIKTVIRDKIDQVDFGETKDKFEIDNKLLNDLLKQIETLVMSFDAQGENMLVDDDKSFFDTCIHDYLSKEFTEYLKEIDRWEIELDEHFKTNTGVYLKNQDYLNKMTRKFENEFKKLLKDAKCADLREFFIEKINSSDNEENFQNFQRDYVKLKEDVKFRKNFSDFVKLDEEKISIEKSTFKELFDQIEEFIANKKIETINYKNHGVNFLDILIEYRSERLVEISRSDSHVWPRIRRFKSLLKI